MDKKAQATSWSFEETGKLVLRILALVILLVMLVALVGIFTQPKPKTIQEQDLERVVIELQDIQPGETYLVPVLASGSSGYSIFVKSIEDVKRAKVNACKLDGDYCACLLDRDDDIVNCITFKVEDTPDIFTPASSVPLDSGSGIWLGYINGEISVDQGISN